MAPYIDRVTRYAKNVVTGKVSIGEFENVKMGRLHKLACQRHLEDLKRQNTPDFPYHYEPARAEHILQFAGTLTLSEGDKPRPLELLDCQAFDLGCRFGWVKNSTGKRRFRRSYKSIARQNGKTMENGTMGDYVALCGGYQHGKLFTVATKKRQARLAWEEMSKFIQADPRLLELFEIKDYKSEILCKPTQCTMEALSKEAGLDDGFRSIYCSVDELHQMKDNSVYKAIYNGTRALDETMISMITTRGSNPNSFCKEMDDYAIGVLEGVYDAPDLFVDIYCPDAEDDIWDEMTWIKANPFIFSRPQLLDVLRQDAQTAKDMQGSELRDFMTKSLNLWTRDESLVFTSPEAWKACESAETLEDHRGRRCFVGLDLSSGGDLTTFHLEFEPDENGQTFNYSHSFMPRGRLLEHIKTDVAPYDIWEKQGLLTVTGGEYDFKNDYKFIIKELAELREKYDLVYGGIGIDSHNADGVLADLEAFGVPVVIVVQSAKSLNDATVEVQLDIKSGSYRHDSRNELMSWSFINAATVGNSFGEIKVDKQVNARCRRIDPVDAAIDARVCRLKLSKEEQPVDMNDSLSRYMDAMGWK